MTVSTQQIKELREKTGAGVMDCKEALEKSGGDFERALEAIREKGLATAAKRSDRKASEGIVEMYSHGEGRVGVMVEVNCETDFVARSEAFRTLAHETALQIAAAAPKYVDEGSIPEEILEEERSKAINKAKEEGKPEKVWDRIVEGYLDKYKDENCLLRQPYIRDEELVFKKLLLENIAAIGENIIIRRFARWEVGENEEHS